MWLERMFIVSAYEERLRELSKNWRPFCLPAAKRTREIALENLIISALYGITMS